MFVPHRKHIISPLRAQEVNAVYKFVTMVHQYNYHNSGSYSSSCLLFKTHDGQRLYLTWNTLRPRYESNRLIWSIGLCQWYINITATIAHIISRSVFSVK
jgi:hypothetical protein